MAAGKWNMQKASGGVASITVVDGTTNTAVVLPESGTVATTDNIVGFKNYIINGNFDVWQYGLSQTISGYGSDDRWTNNNNGSTKTQSQVACTDTERALFNAAYFSRTVVSSVVGASNFTSKTQIIEDVTKLAGKTVTVSFWARASSTLNIQLNIAQDYGTGGSPSTKTHNPQTPIQLTSTWQKKTVTINIPSIVGKLLGTDGVNTSFTQLYFIFESGASWLSGITIGQQSGTFDIAQVQLEEGSVATPFENLSYALQYEQCRRYYRRYATQQNVNDLAYKMRTTPTESGTAPYTYSAEL